MPSPNVHIKKSEDKPESAEILASAIIQISESSKKMLAAGLTERALIVLLQDGIGASSISKGQIKLVLWALPKLRGWYCR